MRKSIRAALLACAVLSTLAFASTALAAYRRRSSSSSSLTPQAQARRAGRIGASSTTPTIRQRSVAIYIPAGYQIATRRARARSSAT